MACRSSLRTLLVRAETTIDEMLSPLIADNTRIRLRRSSGIESDTARSSPSTAFVFFRPAFPFFLAAPG